jgi:hypothetical protein
MVAAWSQFYDNKLNRRNYMKKTSLLLGAVGLIVTGILVINVSDGESEREAETNISKQSIDGKTDQTSSVESQKVTAIHLTNSAIETKFKDESYSFSLEPRFVHYEDNVSYKDEQVAKEHLQSASNYLNKLTKSGTNFSAAAWLQDDDEWTNFVEDIARLKYENFAESQVLNDLDVVGALILQAERHYDEPSLRYLYEIISDLNSGSKNEADKYGVTLSFGEEEQFQEVHKYLQSKI